MDLDTIFTILFILFIVLFQVLGSVIKKAGKQDETLEADDEKTAGLGGRLKNVLERVREEMEAAREAATIPPSTPERTDEDIRSRQGGWEAIKTEPGPERDDRVPARKPSAVKTLPSGGRPTGYPPGSAGKPGNIKTGNDRVSSDRFSKKEQRPAATAIHKRPLSQRDSRSEKHRRIMELRRAVIWSEIMAPPLALRQDRD